MMNRCESDLPVRDFITKNLPLLKAQVIESFHLQCFPSLFQPEDIKNWVGTTVSRGVSELIIDYDDKHFEYEPVVLLPSSLYSCKSLVTLKLVGKTIVVDVPRTVSLPSLKTLELASVVYFNEDSLRLLLLYCPVLEDLVIRRGCGRDNLKNIVIDVPSLLRLTLPIGDEISRYGYVILTPLKYFKVWGLHRKNVSYLLTHMPKEEEADLIVAEDDELVFESIPSIKRLSLSVFGINDKFMYHDGIVFNQLEHLKLNLVCCDNWSKLLVRLLKESPKLRVLKLDCLPWSSGKEYEHDIWTNDDQSTVPKCLLDSLEIFEFVGYMRRPQVRAFVSYILKHACHLKSSSISSR